MNPPAAKKPRVAGPKRLKGKHKPAQCKKHAALVSLRKQLAVSMELTAKKKAILRKGKDLSMNESLKRPEWRPTDRKIKLDALNVRRKAEIIQRRCREVLLREKIADAQWAYDHTPKMERERSDGEPVAARVYMEMVFGHLWKPLLLDDLRHAVRFQRCCMDWRLAARSHVAHRPVFIPRIPRYAWAQTYTLHDAFTEHGRETMRVEFRNGFKTRSCFVMVGGPVNRMDAHALVQAADDPQTLVLLIQEDGRCGDPTRIICAGGTWKCNHMGDVCDWARIPFGIVEERHPRETAVSWIRSAVKSEKVAVVSTNVVPGAQGSIQVAIDVAEAKLVLVGA